MVQKASLRQGGRTTGELNKQEFTHLLLRLTRKSGGAARWVIGKTCSERSHVRLVASTAVCRTATAPRAVRLSPRTLTALQEPVMAATAPHGRGLGLRRQANLLQAIETYSRCTSLGHRGPHHLPVRDIGDEIPRLSTRPRPKARCRKESTSSTPTRRVMSGLT